MEIVKQELEVPVEYLKCTDGRISAIVHRRWLASFSSVGFVQFIKHERLSSDEIAAQPSTEQLGSNWLQIYITVSIVPFSKNYLNGLIEKSQI